MICLPPSFHKNGERYQIIGTDTPMELTEKQALQLMQHIDNICRNNEIKYLENRTFKLDNKIKHMIKTLQIDDDNVKIVKGNRHNTLLSIANSLLWTHNNSKNISEEKLRDFFFEINNKLCIEPSPEEEVKQIWKDVLSHINKHQKINTKESPNSNSPERNKIIRETSKQILSKYNFATIEETKEILYYQRGVYLKGGETLIEKEAEQLFGYNISNSHINEIKGHIIRRTFVKSYEFDKDLNIVNVSNGLYNIKENKLKSHTPTYFSRNQKPIHFDPNAKPQLVGKFLSEVLYPHEIRTAVEMMAYTFLRDNPYEVYCILIGIGANGKGVFTGIISKLHGFYNVSNVPLEAILNEKFALADTENKDVNIDTELSNGIITDISVLKKITGRQPVRIQRKNQQPYESILYAKQFFSSNKIPSITDDSDGRFRREIPISFPNQFQDGINADPKLLEKLTTPEELSGIFNVLMKALRRVQKNNGIFLNQKTIQERREKNELTINSVKSFAEKNIVISFSLQDYVIKDNLYQEYVRFCRNEQVVIIQRKVNFGRELKKLIPELDEWKESSGERRTIWKGIRLVNWETNKQFISV